MTGRIIPVSVATECIRFRCPKECGYCARQAIWCHDPACCDQDLASFLATLATEERQLGLPAFLVRFLDDPREHPVAPRVRIWTPASVVPVFTGPHRRAIEHMMRHTCPAAA